MEDSWGSDGEADVDAQLQGALSAVVAGAAFNGGSTELEVECKVPCCYESYAMTSSQINTYSRILLTVLCAPTQSIHHSRTNTHAQLLPKAWGEADVVDDGDLAAAADANNTAGADTVAVTARSPAAAAVARGRTEAEAALAGVAHARAAQSADAAALAAALEREAAAKASDDSPQPLWVLFNSRTLMGCADPPFVSVLSVR